LPEIVRGSIVTGPQWPEPVEVVYIEKNERFILFQGTTITSRRFINQTLSYEEFKKLKILSGEEYFTEESWKVFLSLEAMRYRFASLYDPLLAMNTSKVDPLPHQIEAVYGYVLKLPRIRFLIADDPGAGKTIMAGLIIKELKLRNLAQRILIVVPGHLKDQWRRELKERFEESFVVVERNLLDALYGESPWQRESQIITSIDFAKREEILPSIKSSFFNLVIVDEAHKMSAYRYGDKIEKTGRYYLGETLSSISEHLLFLTATPHKGDPENFRLFLDLLSPGFFANQQLLQESIVNRDNPLFIRRVKEDLNDFEGKPLFLPRKVITRGFHIGTESKPEAELYNQLSKYVETQYNRALVSDKKRNIAFALVILQRRLASSTYALQRSLERRKKRLEELLEGKPRTTSENMIMSDFDTVEDLSEEERWEQEEKWERLSMAETREELKKEIETLNSLLLKAQSIIQKEQELKICELKETLAELRAKFSSESDKKVLIFTESRDTLDYLYKKITSWGYTANTIHGGMKLEERIQAEKVFKNETQVLIATEAAGEGINLQFCHLMINYDIPWNPNRLEQRMGRIHRYGQQKEVFVFNLVSEDTREGKVFKRLFDKLDEIRRALGSDKVFDCLGEIFGDKNLAQLLIEAAANARDIDEILETLNVNVDEEYIASVKENLGESLATHYIDYTRIKEMASRAKENRLIPEYTESFFKKAIQRAGGKVDLRKDGFLRIDSIPYEIRQCGESDDFRKQYGTMLKAYSKATFDKEVSFKNPDAEFISFGHPLFEATLRWVENTLAISLLTGATFLDPDNRLDGSLLFYDGEIDDGAMKIAGKRLFAVFTDGTKISILPPSIIWDLEETQGEAVSSELIVDYKKRALDTLHPEMEKYLEEIRQERLRQSHIKEKYGVQSLKILIDQLDYDILLLSGRQERGENVDLALRNKIERKKEYERNLKKLIQDIEKEKTLSIVTPRFVGILRIKPKNPQDKNMVSDSEIEKIGMDFVMDYERQSARIPEDVSAQNLGFDIRSLNKSGSTRYIEVKARAKLGAVALTQNEWFKARRFGDEYYLYVVYRASSIPELYIIKNPAESIHPEEKIETVRYIISSDLIMEKGRSYNHES